VENLMMAGRPISASYVAFSSTRVLRTGAIVGQGVGTAAALCRKHGCTPRELAARHGFELRQTLLRDDCFLPGEENADPADLARGARVTGTHAQRLEFPVGDGFQPLTRPLAQLFPVSTRRLEAMSLLLRNDGPAARLRLGLRRAAAVYDFRSTEDLASVEADVPAHAEGWVRFELGRAVEPGLYWIWLPATPDLSWSLYRNAADAPTLSPVGATAAEMPGPSRWHPLTNGRNFGLRVAPEQSPYEPTNVVSGAGRPDRGANLYISHPGAGLPATLEITLPRAARFNTVQLIFDTDMNRHTRRPLFRYPDCVKSYELAVATPAGWRVVAEERDNYQRRRVHRFDAVTSGRVRLTVRETNGAASARVYEVRIYEETPASTRKLSNQARCQLQPSPARPCV
jgi:hypothetical protein